MGTDQNTASNRQPFEVFFGGPDMPARNLRNLLAESIAAVPSGGTIDWVTYYFRDRSLARELVRARRRGVRVSVSIDGRPRTAQANDEVARILSGPEGIGAGFRALTFPGICAPSGITWKPHLHEKLYCFSHPEPVAYVGSFNPSGDDPETEPWVVSEIGDQDRGHNLLVGIRDPVLVKALARHAHGIGRIRFPLWYRFSPTANREVMSQDTRMFFWPRLGPHPVARFFSSLGSGAHIRVAASHIKGRGVVKTMAGWARRGVRLEVLAEHTHRRVPEVSEYMLRRKGIRFRRVHPPGGLPMHNKFAIAEKGDSRWAIFGSFNWSARSYWLNYEIGAVSTNRVLCDAFAERWETLSMQAVNQVQE